MLKRVAADDVTKRINLAVNSLEYFCQEVEAEHHPEAAASGVAGRQQQCKRQLYGGVVMHRRVNPQVAAAVKFVQIPLQNAGESKSNEPRRKPQSGRYADALGDERRHQRSENNGHGQPVPNQVDIVWDEMIVTRPQRSEQ